VHLEFSPAIAMAMVECMLGAPPGRPGVPPRPLTPAERRVLHSLAEVAAASLSTAWPGGDKPRLAAEHAPAPLAVQADEEPVAVITFQLAFAGHLGTLRLCAPAGAVEGAIPPRRARRFGDAPLELTAAVEGIMLDEADLAGLAAGDILATDTPVDGEVILRIGGIPKFAARLRTADGRKALTITRRLDGPEPR
jgi:flagellar motor switch protein FliM